MTTVPSFTAAEFGDLMSELPAGVSIITTQGPSGPVGLAVTSMTAYTAEPPTVMVSIADSSRCYQHLLSAEGFGVHLLHNGQEDIAKVFASKADDKFAALRWDWHSGVPQIHGVLAFMHCVREAQFTHHDHTILIGRISEVVREPEVEPMVYLRRRFAWRLSH